MGDFNVVWLLKISVLFGRGIHEGPGFDRIDLMITQEFQVFCFEHPGITDSKAGEVLINRLFQRKGKFFCGVSRKVDVKNHLWPGLMVTANHAEGRISDY